MVITSNLLQSSSSRTTILLSPQPSPRLLIKVMKNIQLNILMTTFLNGQFLLEVQGCHHVKITCFLSTHRFKSIFICLKNNTACVFVIKTMMYKKKTKITSKLYHERKPMCVQTRQRSIQYLCN